MPRVGSICPSAAVLRHGLYTLCAGGHRGALLQALPLSILEPFWHDLFETPSVLDSWLSPITGDVHWELLHPIASKDVVRALKKMKDCVT